ncbi:MAG TPA: indole-3-glycerol-phosphate synthase [Nitrososphaera sp.]|jgi:indole-3-glycerol phosphate synthase|nr:indole-3-glycerol-phosphate synthase [Nitrososphaera sp.]
MSKFVRTNFGIKRLVDNSFKAIDEGAYETTHSFTHDAISIKKAVASCSHSPLITEMKFSSPSRGKIRSKTPPAEIAITMIESGAIGLSVLTQPHLFNGSIEYLATIRKAVRVPLLMKDITVSTVQIDAGKKAGADCILLIKTVFDQNLAEESMEKLAEYTTRKGLQVLVEVHTEQEFGEVIKAKYSLVGINNRNLDDLRVDIANTERLLKKHAKGKSLIVSESGISKPADIQYLKKAGADAFLVGTSIMETEDVGTKVAELYNSL